jgi:hypothetical protein
MLYRIRKLNELPPALAGGFFMFKKEKALAERKII